MRFENILKRKAAAIEKDLYRRAAVKDSPKILSDAMAYSLRAGGKRLRPALILWTAEAFGLRQADALPAASAIEMLHTYSLIHDDLPAMDNDDLRRGKPTNHKIFGEPTAILAGDALLTLAFETIGRTANNPRIGAANAMRALMCLAESAGACGMVGGQSADIFAEGMAGGKSNRARAIAKTVPESREFSYLMRHSDKAAILDYIHRHKTGALLSASVEIGALLAGAGKTDLRKMRDYGQAVGLAFQIADDILDVTADKKKLGKKGSDRDNGKLTFVSLYGIAEARRRADALIKRALGALDAANPKLGPLRELALFITERAY